nr:DnaB [Porphyropsis coccinea]
MYKLSLPNNTRAEQIILAGIISNPYLLNRIVNVVTPELFFNEKHKDIYESVVDIYNNTTNISLLGIINMLTEKDTLKYIGKQDEIEELGNNLINNNKFEEYLYLLLDKFFRRSIIISSQKVLSMALDESKPLDDVIMEFEELFFNLNKGNYISANQFKITSLLTKLIQVIETKKNSRYANKSILSGFTKFDKLTQGFQKSDLIIIASRPSIGKTAFVLNIAKNIASTHEFPVIFFSLEMSSEQLLYRILATESQIPLFNLRQGQFQPKEWNQIREAIKKLAKFNIYIDDTPKVTISSLKSKIYQLLNANKNISIIIIDYLQLIETQNNENDNKSRTQELTFITRSLKIMCREFNLPIIVLSQLSRNVETRNNKRPILSDLRESGCISFKSKIYTSNQIANIWEINLTKNIHQLLYSFNKKNKLVSKKYKNITVNKNKIIYQLITTSGYFLEATSNHKIKTKKGWKRLDQLKQTDKIAIVVQKKIIKTKEQHKSTIYNIQFEPLNTIYLIGKNTVCDIEMLKYPNFIANNIIVHNSIEQDADIVCSIYREEYYNFNSTEQNKQQQNTAEISILKHRNGPTGTFELTFFPKFAQFTE